MYVLGLSCYYHDAAACLLEDGEVIAAAEEERFTREKHDSSFPENAVEYCFEETGVTIADVDHVAFYEKPIEKFDRILETFLTAATFVFRSFIRGMPLWIRKRLWMRGQIRDELGYDGDVLFGDRHESHAASSFFASPFGKAAILTVDGVGEWNTTTGASARGVRSRSAARSTSRTPWGCCIRRSRPISGSKGSVESLDGVGIGR